MALLVHAVASRNETLVIQTGYSLPSSRTTRYSIPLGLFEVRGREPYKRLYLIGHSAGAVIIRQFICTALNRAADAGDHVNHLVANASLRLFAPAHLGVMAAGALGIARSLPITDRILNLRLRSNPLYQSISATSPTLTNLRNETERLYRERKMLSLKAYSVFGEHEDVVFVGGYSHDEQAPTEKNQGHRSICKPTLAYTRPLEFVTNEPAIAKRV